MKKVLIVLGLVITLSSCDKNDDEKTDSSLIGEWGLTEVLGDPGDGSGTFQAVESNKVIVFHDDGTVTSNGVICDMSIEANESSSGTYSLVDSTISSDNCTNQMKIAFRQYDSELILSYPCIEPCLAKYEKK